MSRVALIGENSVEYINILLDIWNNDDCAVLIDWRIPFATAVEMMLEAYVETCYIETGKYDVSAYQGKINFTTYDCNSISVNLITTETRNKFKDNYSKDEAVILYSSGTTGKSKGVILSHYAINTNSDAIIDYMQPNDNDCIYIAKVLSHSSTLTGELLVALKSKTKLVIAPTITLPRIVFSSIENFGVTIICLNPALLTKYADEYKSKRFSLPTLSTIYVSGSILRDEVFNSVCNVFKGIVVCNVYGLTEAGPRVSAQRINCCKSNSVGKPIDGVDIKIVDFNGNIVSQGERGIIHINTPSRFSNYVVGEHKNKSLYNDWLNSGDVGLVDDNGELRITDRVDDLIIIDAHKIYPSDVEQKIIGNSIISECVVVKIETNTDEFIACLYTADNDIDTDIKQKLLKILMPYEIPRIFMRDDKIPTTPNGKIVQKDVVQLLKRRLFDE